MNARSHAAAPLLVALLGLSSVAAAQDAGDETPTVLEEVVVTAPPIVAGTPTKSPLRLYPELFDRTSVNPVFITLPFGSATSIDRT